MSKRENIQFTRTICFLVFFYVAWISAWLLKLSLEKSLLLLTTSAGSFVYWTVMKIFIWILPAYYLLRLSGKKLSVSHDSLRRSLKWGIGTGVLIVLINVLAKAFILHKTLISFEFSFAMLNVAVIAPLVEEFTFRGAVLNGLRSRYDFSVANSLTSFFFLLAHFPGWFFTGSLVTNITSRIAISIFVLGLIMGFVAYKSKSVIGSIIVHALNNLSST